MRKPICTAQSKADSPSLSSRMKGEHAPPPPRHSAQEGPTVMPRSRPVCGSSPLGQMGGGLLMGQVSRAR